MLSPSRLYISLLVHENPEVILDQLANFRRYAPGAVIVVHLALSFNLETSFARQVDALGNVHLNPTRVATNALNLLHPHLVNLRYILSFSPSDEDKVCFHASNDMLVKAGLEAHVGKYQAGYFYDGVVDYEKQSESAKIINADKSFNILRDLAGASTIIWSQIEGAFFSIRHLRSALLLIDRSEIDMMAKRAYYAEEVILPTLIHSFMERDPKPIRVTYPYIFSEVTFWAKYSEISRNIFGSTMAAKILRRILRWIGPIRITRDIIDRIRGGKLGYYKYFKVINKCARFTEGHLFGVKRVERDMSDPLRKYIKILHDFNVF